MDKFIFTYVDKDQNGIFRDLTSEKAQGIIDFLPSHKIPKNSLAEKLKRICLSYQLNVRFNVPFQSLFYNLDSYDYDAVHTYHMIMPTTSISKFTVKYLKEFKARHPNVHLYALVTDSMHASSPHMNLVRDKLFSNVWDKVLTYDKYDAKEFGFTWFGYTYYSAYDFIKPDNIHSDIYYVGFDKGGRNKVVSDVYEYILSGGGKPLFDVVSTQPHHESKLIYLKSKIPYPQVVARVKATNCILEVLQNKQKVQSLRYLEAVVYNKKLLTMNKNITEFPFYDSRFMHIFSETKDIDIDWVKTKENIDFGYKGEFSPLHLVEYIAKLEEKCL